MRNRYLDLLRAAAIVRVIVYHLFGWPWLSIVLPAMGVMFALAGSLTAASLEKRRAGQVVTSRLRRLLPPLWLLGLLAVPIMLVAGWAQESDGEHPFSPARLVLWLVPVGDPPGSDRAVDVWEPLWYLRAYLWFVVLSPVLFAVYRRIGWTAVALPLLLMAALEITGFELPETADAALWDFVTYGACWIAGFAHHDGRLAAIRPWLLGLLTVALGAGAFYWLRDSGTWDLNDVSESQALWSLAFVLLVLRWQPPMGWLVRAAPLDRAVTLLNARAVTVYLWHNIAIAAVWPVLTVLALDDLGDRLGAVTDLVAAFVLTGVAVLLFGWVEDLAARRRPRLWPATDVATSHRATTGAVEAGHEPTGDAVDHHEPTGDVPAHRAFPGDNLAHPVFAGDGPAHRAFADDFPVRGEPTGDAAAPHAQADAAANQETTVLHPAAGEAGGLATHRGQPAPAHAARAGDTASAMADLGSHRRPGAAAAMTRVPANWPPIPRDAGAGLGPAASPVAPDSELGPVAGRRPGPQPGGHDLPVAGRRAEPLPGAPGTPAGRGAPEETGAPGWESPREAPEWFRGRRDAGDHDS